MNTISSSQTDCLIYLCVCEVTVLSNVFVCIYIHNSTATLDIFPSHCFTSSNHLYFSFCLKLISHQQISYFSIHIMLSKTVFLYLNLST